MLASPLNNLTDMVHFIDDLKNKYERSLILNFMKFRRRFLEIVPHIWKKKYYRFQPILLLFQIVIQILY